MKKKALSKRKLGLGLIVLLILGFSFYLVFKKSLLYSYYVQRGNKASLESNQLEYYNDALGCKYTKEVVNDVYESLEGNDNVEKEITEVSNLKDEDRKNIIMNVYKDKADEYYNEENYSQCAYYLRQAEKNGYNIKEYKNYDKLKEALEESGRDTLSSEYRSGDSKDTYYKNDSNYNNLVGYIIPDSYSRKLTKEELEKYDYETLGLIKAEILARHGYNFEDENYKTYFNNKDWYVKDPSFRGTSAEMNDFENYNIKLINDIRREKAK
ncbi:YARHG domain-containing protein [Clostridium sp.]|uniref:YARHG domain-containing protein n=1 Tax=Clostridium sp. TaxID=1506 RepID=UPI00262CA461|nr:YARHG domain-containing protein [Clostridium sp.]